MVTTKPKVNKVVRNTLNNVNVKLVEKYDSVGRTIFLVEPSDSYTIKNQKSQVIASFESEELTDCCGVLVLSSLFAVNSKKYNYKDLIEALDLLVKHNTLTLQITTNGKNGNATWEKALEQSEYWTMVKEFKNPNTGNTIKMWVSNN
jgi:hypothetical protein